MLGSWLGHVTNVRHNAKTFRPTSNAFSTHPLLAQSRFQQYMASQPSTVAQFLEAKAEILETAREAKATDGIISNGHAMDAELVSRNNLFIS